MVGIRMWLLFGGSCDGMVQGEQLLELQLQVSWRWTACCWESRNHSLLTGSLEA